MASEKTRNQKPETRNQKLVVSGQWSVVSGQKPTTSDQRPATSDRVAVTIRDRIFVVNTALFVLVGMVILYRSAVIGLTLLAVAVGGGFFSFGVYRLWLIWRHFKQVHRGS